MRQHAVDRIGVRKYVRSGIAPHTYLSIIVIPLSAKCCHWYIVIDCSSYISAWRYCIRYSKERTLRLGSQHQVCVTFLTQLSIPQQVPHRCSDRYLSDQESYVTGCILRVRRISHRWYSKCYIVLLLSKMQLRWFYMPVHYHHYRYEHSSKRSSVTS